MKQLNVFCEGQTEQGFCVQLLQPHLFPAGDGIVHTLAVGEKDHRHLYGIGRTAKYERVRKFIRNTIKHRQGENTYFTTLFDLYGLPGDFPGKIDNTRNPANPTPYALALQQAFEQDIGHHRFVAHLQLHEYETMLFADPEAFAISFEDCEKEVQLLKKVANSEPSIERIDDGQETAPSKRIINILPEYDGRKSTAGPDIAEYIGLAKIRAACPHFHQWLSRLESTFWEEEASTR